MQQFDKKKLDEIGKALVKADAISAHEIDKIVANNAIFDSVRDRIKQAGESPTTRPFFVRPVLVGFASVTIVAAIAVAYFVLKPKSADVARQPKVDTPQTSKTVHFDKPDQVVEPKLPREMTSPRVERIESRPSGHIVRRKQTDVEQIRYEGDFYALSYAGDPNETERGGRIVRMDVPRSTLFAMGVDVPLENESETVKADLLIGSDGVTRAIRVVK